MRRRMLLSQARLPVEYQEVEWIGASGGQYIDTGYTPSTVTTDWQEFKSVFMITGGSGDRCIGGVRNIDTIKIPNFNGQYIETQFYVQNNSDFSGNLSTLYTYSVRGKSGEQHSTLNGEEHSYTISGSNNYNNSTIYLFALNKVGVASWFFVGRIYSVVISNNNVEQRHFIPCYRKSDNEVGMYDLVGGQFYTNQGTGSFTRGPAVGGVTVISYQDMVDKLVSVGCTTGTDEYGSYVNVNARIVNGITLFSGIFNPNAKYEILVTGYNDNTSLPTTNNMRVLHTDSTFTYLNADAKMIPTYKIIDSSKPIESIMGNWATGTFLLHDFYVKEI